MVMVLQEYPDFMIRCIVGMFMVPSVIFNIVFLLLPIYGKVYIVQRISLFIFKAVIFQILAIYIVFLAITLITAFVPSIIGLGLTATGAVYYYFKVVVRRGSAEASRPM